MRIFNGRDGEWQAVVSEASRKSAVLAVESRLREQTGVPPLRLCFAPVKKSRTDFIVEKATELGASAIQPVITRRTQSERVRTDRLMALATEATEQTERLCLPDVSEPVTLERLLADWPQGERVIFCDESGEGEGAWGGPEGRARPMLDVLQAEPDPSGSWAILIGPEGGFDEHERAHLRSLSFVRAVTLGPRILRADTAAVTALALWQAVLGDWR